MYTSGDVIKDYILQGEDEHFTSFIGYCHEDNGDVVFRISIDKDILFSNVLVKILSYILKNNIPGPYHIYCIYCLDKCDTNEEDLEELRQIQLKNIKSKLYTTDKLSNSRDTSTNASGKKRVRE